MLVPKVFPDETVPSFLARMARLNGYRDARDVFLPSCQRTPWLSVIDTPFSLPEFCCWIRGAMGSPTQLLRNHTSVHGAMILREISDERWCQFVLGKEMVTLAELGGLQSPTFKFCPNCVERDIRIFGQSYWHRIHQPDFVAVCHIHGDVLVKAKSKRAVLHYSLPSPADLISCLSYGDVANSGPLAVDLEIAHFVSDLLATTEKLTASIEAAMFDDLRAKSFVTSSGRLHTKELSGFLVRKLGPTSLSGDNSELVKSVRKSIRSVREPSLGCGLHRALLLSQLFGSWASLKERSAWLAVIGGNKGTVAEIQDAKGKGCDLEGLHKARCLQYMASAPTPTRIGFTRTDYRSFRWLLHNEPIWLEARLPTPKSKQLQLRFV